jgi:hypothetical protein
MAYDQTSTLELLEAMDTAHDAVKQLRQAVALSADLQIGAVCGRTAMTLSDDLAKLERLVGDILRNQKASFRAGQSPSTVLPFTAPSSTLTTVN